MVLAVPLIVAFALAVAQAGVAVRQALAVQDAAAEAARALAVGKDPVEAARASLPSTEASRAKVRHDGREVTVALGVRSLLGPANLGQVSATAGFEGQP